MNVVHSMVKRMQREIRRLPEKKGIVVAFYPHLLLWMYGWPEFSRWTFLATV